MLYFFFRGKLFFLSGGGRRYMIVSPLPHLFRDFVCFRDFIVFVTMENFSELCPKSDDLRSNTIFCAENEYRFIRLRTIQARVVNEQFQVFSQAIFSF
jgi:hypothetical protein